jgi:hypothetical protein
MNPVNKAQVKEFSETFNLTSRPLSEQFELYTVYSVLNGGSGENVNPTAQRLIQRLQERRPVRLGERRRRSAAVHKRKRFMRVAVQTSRSRQPIPPLPCSGT